VFELYKMITNQDNSVSSAHLDIPIPGTADEVIHITGVELDYHMKLHSL